MRCRIQRNAENDPNVIPPQRKAYLDALAEAIHRNLRFLEVVATSPIGLTTDLLSLRVAMPVDGASEERDRAAFRDLTGRGTNPRPLGIQAQNATVKAIELLDGAAPDGENPLPSEWLERADKVLRRVADRLVSDVRKSVASGLDGVYVIVDPSHTRGRSTVDVAKAVLSGGAIAIQLRHKGGPSGAVLDEAGTIREMCVEYGALFIVNDYSDVARIVDADGLHVGQGDLPVKAARQVLAPHQIIGTSNALLQEALDSEAETADYVAVGSIFPTTTKEDTRPAGLETLSEIKRSVGTPVVAIGGINHDNASRVAAAGADAICVATAVTMADDPERATRTLTSAFAGE